MTTEDVAQAVSRHLKGGGIVMAQYRAEAPQMVTSAAYLGDDMSAALLSHERTVILILSDREDTYTMTDEGIRFSFTTGEGMIRFFTPCKVEI